MFIYSSVFLLVRDFFGIIDSDNPDFDQFLYCFLFCEFEEEFWVNVSKENLVELIGRGCPELDLDKVYANLDQLILVFEKMHKYRFICYSKRLKFSFPWQSKAYSSTTWEEYEDFFFERVGIPVTFDKSCPPYFTLALQLKEVDVGFVLK
jgi:hypothetical protein